jgi:hypothetical protein
MNTIKNLFAKLWGIIQRIIRLILVFSVLFDIFKGYVDVTTVLNLLIVMMIDLDLKKSPTTNLTVKDLNLQIDSPQVVNSYGARCRCGGGDLGVDQHQSASLRPPNKATKVTK